MKFASPSRVGSIDFNLYTTSVIDDPSRSIQPTRSPEGAKRTDTLSKKAPRFDGLEKIKTMGPIDVCNEKIPVGSRLSLSNINGIENFTPPPQH